MAGIYQLPRAPETGLSALAQVLLGGAQDYSQNKRADDREARLRAQRLADVESDRTYARTEGNRTYDRARKDRLTDVESDRTYTKAEQKRAAEAAIRQELIRDGYLGPEFIDAPLNSDAVKAAYAAAAKVGLVKNNPMVKGALAAGDLTDAMLESPESLATGLAVHSGRLMAQTAQREQSDKDAQVRLDQIATQRDATRSEQSRLSRILGEPDAAIDPRVVSERARAAATAAIPKAGFFSSLFGGQQTQPSQKAIDELAPAIQQELVNAARISADERRREAIVQKGLLADEAQSKGAEANTLTNRTGRSGRSSFTESGTGAGTVPPAPALPPRTSSTNLDTAIGNFAKTVRRPAAPNANTRLNEPNAAPVFQGRPPADGMEMARRNDAVADVMRTTGNGVANLFRPSSWARNSEDTPSRPVMPLSDPRASVFSYEVSPEVEMRQLQSRLMALSDRQSPTAAAIMNRIVELQRSLAQMGVRNGQRLTESVNTAEGVAPRGLSARFSDPGY